MARKNDWCMVIDSYPGILATDWPLYGNGPVWLLLPSGQGFTINPDRHNNIIQDSSLIHFWSSIPNGSRFSGIPPGSVLTTRQEAKGEKFRKKYFEGKLRTVLDQCADEHYLRFYWYPLRIYANNGYLKDMVDAFIKFHTDYEPLPEHPFVVVDSENHGVTTDLILDTTAGVYEWQRLDFYDHKGRLSYSGYVKEVTGHEVTLTDCLHNEKNRNYRRMPNEPKKGMIGIEPNMNQLCLVSRYLSGEFNDYIKSVMKDFLVSDFKLPKAHVT